MSAIPHPPGLKLYPHLLSSQEVGEILAQFELHKQSPTNPQLFRLFGNFELPSAQSLPQWMMDWGQKMVERGIFSQCPDQYRLCDWMGEFSGNFNWHTDNNRHGEKILAIALSEARVIGFRPKKRTKSIYRLPLNRGDAYLMAGAARWHWEHRVMPVGMQGSGGRSFIMSYKG